MSGVTVGTMIRSTSSGVMPACSIACSAAFPMAGISEDDLIEGVELGGVVTFVELAEVADVVLTY